MHLARLTNFAVISTCLFLISVSAFSERRVVQGTEVVAKKIYPKKSKIQIEGGFGLILNESYSQTMLFGGELTYFLTENTGFNAGVYMGSASDKSERACIETFYNDPDNEMSGECGAAANEALTGNATYGPAYVPIRQISTLLLGHYAWNPTYGKQIFQLSATNYFDFFVNVGGGIAMSTFWPQMDTLNNGKPSRGAYDPSSSPGNSNIGCNEDEVGCYGVDGRPEPTSESTPVISLAVGQRYHFAKRFNFTVKLSDFILIGGPTGFENLLAFTTGFGMRF